MGENGHVWCKRIRKWVQNGRKEFQVVLKETKLVQVELVLVEDSQNTSKCVKLKMKADKLE